MYSTPTASAWSRTQRSASCRLNVVACFRAASSHSLRRSVLTSGARSNPSSTPSSPGRMPLQLFGRADAQQGHEGQHQQRGPQAVEALLQRAIRLLPRVHQAQRQQRRHRQQGAAVSHRLRRRELRGRLHQEPHARQRALRLALHGHAPRRLRVALAPRPRPQPRRLGRRRRRRGGAPLHVPPPQRVANVAFAHPDVVGRLPDRRALGQQLLHPPALVGREAMRARAGRAAGRPRPGPRPPSASGAAGTASCD